MLVPLPDPCSAAGPHCRAVDACSSRRRLRWKHLTEAEVGRQPSRILKTRISPLPLLSHYFLLLLLLACSLLGGSRAQQQVFIHPERAPPTLGLHLDGWGPTSEAGKNHLRDHNEERPAPRPLPMSGTSLHAASLPKHLPTPVQSEERRAVPSAVSPPLDVFDAVVPSQPAHIEPLRVAQVISSPHQRPQQRRKPMELSAMESPRDEADSEVEELAEPSQRRRMERIRARWRKLGPLLNNNRSSIYQRMRLIQHRMATIGGLSSAVPTTVSTSTTPLHVRSPLPTLVPPAATIDSTTPLPSTSKTTLPGRYSTDAVSERVNSRFYTPQPLRSSTAAITSTTSRLMWIIENHSDDIASGRRTLAKPKQLPTPPNGVRRQPPQIEINPAGVDSAADPDESLNSKAKAFNYQMLQQKRLRHTSAQPQRMRAFAASSRLPKNSIISGPVLAPPPSDDNSGDGGISADSIQFAENIVVSSEQDPLPGGDAHESGEDTHHHRRGLIVEKKFKLVPNRIGPRPRLRIRRPGEPTTATAAENPEGEFSNFQKSSFPQPSAFINNRVPERRYPERRILLPTSSPPPRLYPPSPTDIGVNRARVPITTGLAEEPPSFPIGPSPPEAVLVHGASPHPIGAQVPPLQTPLPQRVHARQWQEEHGSVGEQPPQPSPPLSTPSPPIEPMLTTSGPEPPSAPSTSGEESSSGGGLDDSGLPFGQELGTPPPGFHEAFGLNGDGGTSFTASLGPANGRGRADTTPIIDHTTLKTTTAVPPPSPESFVIPENSGLRPVQPPKEFLVGGFGSKSSGPTAFPSPYTGGDRGRTLQIEPPPPPPRTPPPPSPALWSSGGDASGGGAEEGGAIFTGESAFTPNKKGPAGDGYGPAAFPGVAAPPAEVSSAARPIGQGGGAAGLPLPRRPPAPSPLLSETMHMRPMANDGTESFSNQATTVKPSALLNILTKADEGFNQVITHFEQGTPIETAAIDLLEVALGSQKLDSQAKLLSHVDRAIGLENIQRLQRWANTGGALDMFKEQLAKVAKNFKPPPAAQAFTVPPQLEYLFQSSG